VTLSLAEVMAVAPWPGIGQTCLSPDQAEKIIASRPCGFVHKNHQPEAGSKEATEN
jgi:hypothetical protein